MGIYSQEQITSIIKNNPGKTRIAKGVEMANKLMLHVQGKGMASALERCEYFENKEIYDVRKKYALSNKDLFGRLLQQEDMVFTAKGGSSVFNMQEAQEKQLNALLEAIRYGMPLRKWIKDFALQAYRCDPMGVIFMEIEKVQQGVASTPKVYPTYKSIYSIFDYLPNGRSLEFICFQLTASEAIAFGVADPDLKNYPPDKKVDYYRFVDDDKDVIEKRDGDTITEALPSIKNPWKKTPGFVISNLMMFNDPECFLSPLYLTTELADSFLNDRSVRDIQKRLHGFAKAVEPLLTCPACLGTQYVEGNSCPDCKGSGYRLQTKVADVARFPLEILEKGSFDFRKIFGYVTPDVTGWDKQDNSLQALDELIEMTYWGAVTPKQTAGPAKGQGGIEETATKSLIDLQPRYARLNMTADWAEKTEMLIVDFIGQYVFSDSFNKSSIAYGRYYVLETPEALWALYQNMRTKGAPEATLYETLEKYYHSVYQNSPMELAARLKLLYVEPFPHLSIAIVKTVATDQLDINCKLYFGEWYSNLTDIEVIVTSTDALRLKLKEFVKAKNLPAPAPPATPAFGN